MKFRRFSNPFHPGEILGEQFLSQMGLSQREFARKIGWSTRKLNEIIRKKRSVTAMSAIELAEVLGTTPEFWMNLQQTWDLAQAYDMREAG